MSVAGMGLWCVPWGGGSLRSSVGVGGLAGLMGWGLLFVIGSSSLCDTSPSPSLIITTSSSGPPPFRPLIRIHSVHLLISAFVFPCSSPLPWPHSLYRTMISMVLLDVGVQIPHGSPPITLALAGFCRATDIHGPYMGKLGFSSDLTTVALHTCVVCPSLPHL